MRFLENDHHHPDSILVELDVPPCPAPRQSRKDAYDPCPSVLRYRAFRDHLALEWNLAHLDFPAAGASVSFWLPMPKSWHRRKKIEMQCQPHRCKPDLDNLVKATIDSLYRGQDDGFIYDLHASKFWHPGSGCIRIELPI